MTETPETLETSATFTLKISTRSPFSGNGSKGELSDFDQSRLYYHCGIHCDGKAIAVESPTFSKDSDVDRYRAYNIFRECIAENITRYVLPVEECPQYKFVDGVVTPCDINDQQAL
jgi:hypothetical protein